MGKWALASVDEMTVALPAGIVLIINSIKSFMWYTLFVTRVTLGWQGLEVEQSTSFMVRNLCLLTTMFDKKERKPLFMFLSTELNQHQVHKYFLTVLK